MTTAHEIIARAVAGDDWREGEYRLGMGEVRDADELNGDHRVTADDIIATLTAAGFRIVGPGEVDKETVEKCAEVVRGMVPNIPHDGPSTAMQEVEYMALGYALAAIRALADEKRP